MPFLQNNAHEAFAAARARGATLDDAYEDAGFAPGNNHASRLAKRPDIAERIAEFRALQTDFSSANGLAVIEALLRVAKAAEGLETAAGIKEARLALVEVERMRVLLTASRERDRREIGKVWEAS